VCGRFDDFTHIGRSGKTSCRSWESLARLTLDLARARESTRCVLISQHRIVRPAVKHGSRVLGSRRTPWALLVTTQCLGCIASARRAQKYSSWYSNAAVFPRALVPLSAQIRAQRSLGDRHAPSSQRGGQGFESPQLHRHHRRSKALFRSGMRAVLAPGAEMQQLGRRWVTRAPRAGPRVAMQIMRHSKIAVTMEIYTQIPVRSQMHGSGLQLDQVASGWSV